MAGRLFRRKAVMHKDLNGFIDTVIDEGLVTAKSASKRRRLRYYLERIFNGVSFENKVVLDIGGGGGVLSFFAACSGASKVVCLEPEAAGSSSGKLEKFNRARNRLQLDQVQLETTTFQNYDPGNAKFDVVILHDSVNHLDEPACIDLLTDDTAREVYRSIFSRMHSICSAGAKLIVCDCSRYNFFAHLGVKHPVARSIEWHKHQSPNTWARLLYDAGFRNPEIVWRAPSFLRSAGEKLLGNRIAAYFLFSTFCLYMEKPLRSQSPAGIADE